MVRAQRGQRFASMLDSRTIMSLAVLAPAILLSLSVHEFAHAWVATRLGDDTPTRQGRLTLSPLSHIDPIGTLLVPAVLVLAGAGMFGWARPVQFQPTNFTRKLSMWQGTALTAAAGPLSNFVLAILSALALRAAFAASVPLEGFAGTFLISMIGLNVMLGVFNLFPLPPLDGAYLIPRSLDHVREFLTKYSMILFIFLFFVPLVGGRSIGSILIGPIQSVLMRGVAGIAGLDPR